MSSGVCPRTKDERTFLFIKRKVCDVNFTNTFYLSWRVPGVFSVGFYDNLCVEVVYCSGLADTNTKKKTSRLSYRMQFCRIQTGLKL